MSAYLCDAQHVGRLAEWAARTNTLTFSGYSEAAEIAEVLARANLKSIAARYPDAPNASTWVRVYEGMQPDESDEAYVAECKEVAEGYGRPEIRPIDIIKSAQCLEYQSCEFEGYFSSEAHSIITRIIGAAISKIHGYSEAHWGAPKTQRDYEAEARRIA